MRCPCGLESDYARCCGRFVSGDAQAPTPETLMRSRYTAYVRRDIDYLVATHHPRGRPDPAEVARAAEGVTFWRLVVTACGDTTVSFQAYYRQGAAHRVLSERSRFEQVEGRWYYVDGDVVVRDVARNEPCPCGSGDKYKRCCGGA